MQTFWPICPDLLKTFQSHDRPPSVATGHFWPITHFLFQSQNDRLSLHDNRTWLWKNAFSGFPRPTHMFLGHMAQSFCKLSSITHTFHTFYHACPLDRYLTDNALHSQIISTLPHRQILSLVAYHNTADPIFFLSTTTHRSYLFYKGKKSDVIFTWYLGEPLRVKDYAPTKLHYKKYKTENQHTQKARCQLPTAIASAHYCPNCICTAESNIGSPN